MAKTPFERTSTAGINRTKRDGTVLSGVPAHGYNTKTVEPKAEVAVKEEVVVTITAEEPEPTPKPKKVRRYNKRAHTKDGKFKADDPSTPDVNEAYIVDSSK